MHKSLSKKRDSPNQEEASIARKTRRQKVEFNWKSHCFYCAKHCDDDRHKDRNSTYRIVDDDSNHPDKSISFRDNVLHAGNARNDQWAESVRSRLVNCNDFVSVKARYHISCRDRFNLVSVNSAENSFVDVSLDPSVDFSSKLNESFLNRSCSWRPLVMPSTFSSKSCAHGWRTIQSCILLVKSTKK